jgi:hypothetical protein
MMDPEGARVRLASLKRELLQDLVIGFRKIPRLGWGCVRHVRVFTNKTAM